MRAILAWDWLACAVHPVRCGSLTRPARLGGRYDASDTRRIGARAPRVIEPSYRRRYLTIVNKQWRLAGTFPSTAMSEQENFSVPQEIAEILERLPPHLTLNVPDHILSLWFPPGPANGVMEGAALARAQSYAQSCACRFAYHGSVREGVFYKPIPSDD